MNLQCSLGYHVNILADTNENSNKTIQTSKRDIVIAGSVPGTVQSSSNTLKGSGLVDGVSTLPVLADCQVDL